MGMAEDWSKAKKAYQAATGEKRPTDSWFKTGTGLTPAFKEMDAWLVSSRKDIEAAQNNKNAELAGKVIADLNKIKSKVLKAGKKFETAMFKSYKIDKSDGTYKEKNGKQRDKLTNDYTAIMIGLSKFATKLRDDLDFDKGFQVDTREKGKFVLREYKRG